MITPAAGQHLLSLLQPILLRRRINFHGVEMTCLLPFLRKYETL